MFGGSEQILGMNARNFAYIKTHNPRLAVRIADDKLLTKKKLAKFKIPTMPMIDLFESFSDVEEFDWSSLPDRFVLKPNQGFGGEGIWVINGKTKDGWRLSGGRSVNVKMLKEHIYDIFDGNFSLGNVPDIAYIEEKIKLHKIFKKITYGGGIPDIRVIVYNLIPVMAMLRLPTNESGGKANLHQGGIGVGIEIASGITTRAIWHDKAITRYPGTKTKLHGIKLPYWKDVLEMASQCQKISGLGYLGVDVVLDAKRGPLILELNARPGLGIQNANLLPLKTRLNRVEGLKISEPSKAVRVARELFGEEVGVKIDHETTKPVIKSIEDIVIIGKGGKKIHLKAKVDTGAYRTAISTRYADKLKLGKLSNKKLVRSSLGEEWRHVYDVELIIAGKKLKTQIFLSDRDDLRYDAIIGRKDLKNFLIDPSKKRNIFHW